MGTENIFKSGVNSEEVFLLKKAPTEKAHNPTGPSVYFNNGILTNKAYILIEDQFNNTIIQINNAKNIIHP